MKHSLCTIIALTALLCTSLGALEFSPGLLTVSAGSWIATPTGGEPIYFNKFSITSYMTIQGFKVVPSIPIAWTYESSKKRQRIFPGDGSIYIGRRIGSFEPRIGMSMPLGYANDRNWKNRAWISTNNVKAELGLAYGRTEDELEGMPISLEAMIATPLTEKNAYLRMGSISMIAFGKTYWRISEDLRWGGEFMVLASRSIWNWVYQAPSGKWEQVIESSIGALPSAWAEVRHTQNLLYSLKVGFGPQFKYSNQFPTLTHSANSLNVSLGAQWYF